MLKHAKSIIFFLFSVYTLPEKRAFKLRAFVKGRRSITYAPCRRVVGVTLRRLFQFEGAVNPSENISVLSRYELTLTIITHP